MEGRQVTRLRFHPFLLALAMLTTLAAEPLNHGNEAQANAEASKQAREKNTDEDEPAPLKGAKALRSADEALRQQMMVISRQLGVTCTTCHTTKNFAANDKWEFKVAKEHMRLTQVLIDNGFDGKEKRPKADCFMCHRGKLKPDYLEKFDPMTMDKGKHKSH